MAMSWLDNQHHNRPVREHVVEMYRRDMQLGNWELTGQGISLDRDGLLVDGQHRLAALVRFNRPVWMLVTRGVSHDVAIRACDSGPPRTGGQRMGMQGEKNGALKAAISRGLFVLTNPEVPHSGMVPHSNLNTALNRYRQSIEAVVGGSSLVRVPSLPRAIAAAMIDVVPEYGIPFIEGVMTGANLASGDSRLALRNWMSARVGKSSYEEMWARSIAAADAFMNDESVHKLMSSSRTRYIRWASNLNLPVNRSLLTAISR
jgi:hypothetical protein